MLVGQMALNPTLNPNATGTSAPVHVSPPLKSSSPSKSSADMTNPDLHRILNEVVPLDECEVFSWYPEPEYDPHIDAEDGETSEDGFELDAEEEAENKAIGADKIEVDETPASWGQGGMELDDMPKSVQMVRTWSSSGKDRRKSGVDTPEEMGDDEREGGRGSRAGGLLWSANFFFYSKCVVFPIGGESR